MKGGEKSYLAGFALSIILTLSAYFAVVNRVFPGPLLVATIISLALVQLIVQLFFFLHIGKESGPKWKLAAFISTASIVFIIVVGSLWIMSHLNYNMIRGTDTYMMHEEAIQK